MRKLWLLLLSVIFGCSLNYNDYISSGHPKKKMIKSENKKEEIKTETVVKKESNEPEPIEISANFLDSLYQTIAEQEFIIDSLNNALDISNSRVAVNQDFVIPDTIYFAGRSFDLTNERVFEKFRTIYNQELRSAHRYIPRSGKYFTYFDSVFSAHNIPLDVKFLAIAESRLSPFAGSRVGALGIWQFMPSTAKGFGLKINSFIDERRNVFAATVTAAKYLQNAHAYLAKYGADDWLLSMAAYNAGAGSISKVIRQQGSADFFNLMLRVDETNKYVWRAAAIKLIMLNQKKIFGKEFDLQKSILNEHENISVTLKGHYKIDSWVKAQGSNLGDILKLNPWIKIYKRQRRIYSAVNNVVLPPGNYEILMPKNRKQNSGEISKLEKQFLNKNAGFFTHHIVKRGDNLYDIAKKYKTTVAKIKMLNGLRSNVIHPNQKLKLHGTAGSNTFYVVKRGDTVGGIANKLGISSKKLISANNLKNNNGIVIIRPGQKLYY